MPGEERSTGPDKDTGGENGTGMHIRDRARLGLLAKITARIRRREAVTPTIIEIGTTTIGRLEELGLITGLECIMSGEADRVLVIMTPCLKDYTTLRLPLRYRGLRRLLAELLTDCTAHTCTSPTSGLPYPEVPSPARCKVLQGDDTCRVLLVLDR